MVRIEEAPRADGAVTAPRARGRALAVGWAVAAAAAAWILIEPIGGIDLRSPPQGASQGFDIGLLVVVLTAGAASFASWGLLAALERWTRRPAIWTWIALAVFLVSLSGPLSVAGIPAGHRAPLASLHVVVAATLIPLMRRTIRR